MDSAAPSHAVPLSGYSRYVGRVGALAFALGIGAAIAAMPIAAADTVGSEGATGTTASTEVGQTRAQSGAVRSAGRQRPTGAPQSGSPDAHRGQPEIAAGPAEGRAAGRSSTVVVAAPAAARAPKPVNDSGVSAAAALAWAAAGSQASDRKPVAASVAGGTIRGRIPVAAPAPGSSAVAT